MKRESDFSRNARQRMYSSWLNIASRLIGMPKVEKSSSPNSSGAAPVISGEKDAEAICARPSRVVMSSWGCFALGLRSEEHTSELQLRGHLVCRLLLEKKK